jgi:hypothetical protein
MRRVLFALALTLAALPVPAGTLDEMLSNLNVQAQADRNGFAARIASQFHIGDANVRMVLGSVQEPADAFMVYQLGQLAQRPPEEVLRVYQRRGRKGWGELAKELGIKPGSREFHALKAGDFRLEGGAQPGGGPGRGKGHGKGHGKGKGKGVED